MARKRRGHGEGAIFQRHTKDCPAKGLDGQRPDHRCTGPWVAEINLGVIDGRRVRKTIYGRTRKETAIKLQTALAQKADHTLVLKNMTVEAWLTYWLNVICTGKGLKPNTLKSHRSKIEQYIIPALGPIRLDRLQPEHIRTLYAQMKARDLSDGTVRNTHQILRRALDVAVKERKAVYNPAAVLELDPPQRKERPRLTFEQALAVLAEAGDDPRPYLALVMGMRQGECLALRWADIDLDAGALRIERSLSVKQGPLLDNGKRGPGELVFVVPKTKKSRAPLPLPTIVLSRLKVAHARHLMKGGEPWGLVFSRPDGSPIGPAMDSKAWHDLLARAGVNQVPLHAARNTAAALLRSLGVPLDTVREILRHTDVEMTLHYAGDDLAAQRSALDRLGRALEAGRSDE